MLDAGWKIGKEKRRYTAGKSKRGREKIRKEKEKDEEDEESYNAGANVPNVYNFGSSASKSRCCTIHTLNSYRVSRDNSTSFFYLPAENVSTRDVHTFLHFP